MYINLKKPTLFSKLSVTIMLFVTVITLIITIVSTQLSAYIIRNETYNNNVIFLNKMSNLLESKLHEIDKTLVNFSMKEIDADDIESNMADTYKRYTIYKKLEQLKYANDYIESVYIFFNAGDEVYYHLYSENDNGICNTDEFYDNFIYYRFIRDGNLSEVAGSRTLTNKTPSGKKKTSRVVSFMKTLPLSNVYTENAIVFNIKEEYIIGLIDDSYLPENSIVLISDWSRKPILSYYNNSIQQESKEADDINEIRNQIRTRINGKSALRLNINNTSYYVTEFKPSTSNRIFTLALPESEMFKPISIFNMSLFLLFCVILGFSIVFSTIIDRKYFQPVLSILQSIKNRMTGKEILHTNINMQSKKNGINEFDQLTGYINSMISVNNDQQKQLESCFKYYRERVLYSLLNSEVGIEGIIDKDSIFHNNQFKYFCVVLINIKRIVSDSNIQDYSTFSNNIAELVIVGMSKFGFVQKVQINLQKSALLLFSEKEVSLPVITQELKVLLKEQISLTYSINAAIGSICNSINTVKDSYQIAEKLLHYSLESEDSQVIDADQFENDIKRNYFYPKKIENQIIKDINKNNTAGIMAGIANLFSYFNENRINLHRAKWFAFALIHSVTIQLNKNNRLDNNLLQMENIYDDLATLVSLKEMENWLIELFKSSFAKTWSDIYINNNELVNKVLIYINTYYMRDIGLNVIAEYVYLSPSYFAKIFKEVTGCTFIDYLISIRMKIAGELLQNSDLKVTDVYEKVGYLSIQSFNKAFKNYYKCTPSEFRKKSAAEFLLKDI